MRITPVLATWLALLPAAALAALPAEQTARNVRVYDKAWSIVGRRYWNRAMHGLDWSAERARFLPAARDATDTHALYVAINALLDRLGDSHVYAVAPDPRPAPMRSGQSEAGFGLDAHDGPNGWIVHRLVPGGPAERAGVRLGWRLIAVDGHPPSAGTMVEEAETATLLLEDEAGARHTVPLRAMLLPEQPSRRVRELPGGILLLAFDQFSTGEDRWIADQLRRYRHDGGVILDLRENEGGEAAILDRIAGMFVADRQVVLSLSARRTREERTSGRPLHLGPLAILVGPRTASAAEALAAFLDHAGRAQTVGERTAGKLTAGIERRLPDGGRLTVAEQDIRVAGGRRLEGTGFMPAFVVRPSLAEWRAGRDPALARAIALLGYDAGASVSMSPPRVR